MKKLTKLLTPCVLIFSCLFALARAQGVVQTPTQEIPTHFSWPQVATVLSVAALSFAGIIMWQWVRKRG